jgi:uncharacterized protein with PIN domain
MPMIAVDTNVLLAAADRDEPRHGACAEILRRYRGELVVPAPVVAEASWMIEPRLGPAAEVRFVRAVANAELVVADLTGADYARCAELIDQYSDMAPRPGRRQRGDRVRGPGHSHRRYSQPPGLQRRPPPPHRRLRTVA